MLIWGSTGKEVRLAEGQFHCPQCSLEQPYRHVRIARYFTLYFIPLFQTENRGEYIICQACRGAFDLQVLNYRPPTVFDQWVEYRVVDTGDGVAPEHLPHLFDRFYRADTARDRRHGGSGIGLAIARALVEAHGGGISVTSPGPGHGTTFTVRLPEHR